MIPSELILGGDAAVLKNGSDPLGRLGRPIGAVVANYGDDPESAAPPTLRSFSRRMTNR